MIEALLAALLYVAIALSVWVWGRRVHQRDRDAYDRRAGR